MIDALKQYRASVSHQHLLNSQVIVPDALDESKFSYYVEPLVLNKITLSPSIINPALTQDEIKAMDQKAQMLMIFERL